MIICDTRPDHRVSDSISAFLSRIAWRTVLAYPQLYFRAAIAKQTSP